MTDPMQRAERDNAIREGFGDPLRRGYPDPSGDEQEIRNIATMGGGRLSSAVYADLFGSIMRKLDRIEARLDELDQLTKIGRKLNG